MQALALNMFGPLTPQTSSVSLFIQSSTLSAFIDTDPKPALFKRQFMYSLRRSLVYGLHRNYDLSVFIAECTTKVIKSGALTGIEIILEEIRTIFDSTEETDYDLRWVNECYLADLIQWVTKNISNAEANTELNKMCAEYEELIENKDQVGNFLSKENMFLGLKEIEEAVMTSNENNSN